MSEQITIRNTAEDLGAGEFAHPEWQRADEAVIDTYWSGADAPAGRHFAVRLLWSETSLYLRFDARQDEPLVVSADLKLAAKTMGLWERDVCELFIAPDAGRPERYFEFEVAPTGEWLDLGISIDGEKRSTDVDYASNMEAAAEIRPRNILMGIKVPFEAFGLKPSAGETWAGNIFRCVGSGPERGFLAWRPTFTAVPNFHVPSRFGRFVFES
jgi:hypothetical protein